MPGIDKDIRKLERDSPWYNHIGISGGIGPQRSNPGNTLTQRYGIGPKYRESVLHTISQGLAIVLE